MALPTNTRLGRYEIRALLGAGGMGEVYLAHDTALRRSVAIKLLPADIIVNKDRLNRFEREAFTASSLNHPNILTIYEIGAANAHPFIATEFIDGESLRQHIKGKRLELHEVLEIGIQIASALGAAHAAAIIHRDIKPENVMVRRDGIIKVLDFGLAKLIEQEAAAFESEAPTQAFNTTEPGVVMGTVSYMSPEQTRGKDVDARTDIWSFGVVLYEMVTGRLPFDGETPSDTLAAILKTEPTILTRYVPEAPAELERILTKALRKDKDERYQSVKDFGLDLKGLKQRLEFQAELERTVTPEKNAEANTLAAGERGRTSSVMVASTGGTGVERTARTSSAEYIVSRIRQHKRGAVIILAALLVTAAVGYLLMFRHSSHAAMNSVAVLPFVNTSNDPNREYLADGISESLINRLSQLPQLKVIARSSAFMYKGKEVDVQEAARALGVEAIVLGRITQRGDNLQISAELVNAKDKTQMWGEQYTRKSDDLQTIQADISREIADKLRVRLTGSQEQQMTKQATQNAEAYKLYLTGKFYVSKEGLENRRKGIDYFNQAIAVDSNFALAYAALADAYRASGINSEIDPKEAAVKGRAAATRALALDDTVADAHVALAGFDNDDWEWSRAETEFKRAIALNPNLADAHHRYSQFLSTLKRFSEASTENKRAQELDPLRTRFKVEEGNILFFQRRYDEAIQQLENATKLEPDNSLSHGFLGYAYAGKGRYADAINEYQKYMSLEGEATSLQIYRGYAYAMSGKRDQALAILKELKTTTKYVSPTELAVLYAGLGDKEAAFQSLERAYIAHDPQLQFLTIEPAYDALRSDPRFADLVRRVGLPW